MGVSTRTDGPNGEKSSSITIRINEFGVMMLRPEARRVLFALVDMVAETIPADLRST